MSLGAFLVTGGSRGIGAAVAHELLRCGRRVGVISRRTPQLPFPPNASLDWIKSDLTDSDATLVEVDCWLDRLNQPCDGVVLSAVSYGVAPRHAAVSCAPAECDGLWNINFRSQYVVLSRLLPVLLTRPRAVIIAISSRAAFEPAPGRALYAATKAASLSFFRSLSEELSGTGVSVVQAFPRNQVRTPGLQARRPPDFEFAGYDAPEIFGPLTMHIHRTLGADMSGAILAVDTNGGWMDRRECLNA